MIAHLIIIVLPRVEVQVLQQRLRLAHRPGAHKHVVQLLRVHVEQVCVALRRLETGGFVEVDEGGAGHEGLEGCDLGELVEIAGSDDACLRVLLKDLGNEVLYGGRD